MLRFCDWLVLRNAAICSITYSKTTPRRQQSILGPKAEQEPRIGNKSHSSASLLLQPRFNEVADLRQGKRVHAHIIKTAAAFEEKKLVNMYASFDSLDDVRRAFEKMPERNEVVWNSTIAAYARLGHWAEALQLFRQMRGGELKPNPFVFATVVSVCTGMAGIEEGKQIHTQIIKTGSESDIFVGSALLHMYGTVGYVCLENARQVFDKMPQRNVVSWTAMMVAYVRHGHAQDAWQLYQQMQAETIGMNSKSFAIVLSACSCLEAIEQGKQTHAHIIKTGFESSASVGNGLVSVYAKCGSANYACKAFNQIQKHDTISWNAVISGYAHCGMNDEALEWYQKMKWVGGIKPDSITLTSALSSCTSLEAPEQGKQLHAETVKTGLEFSVSVGNALITMYAKAGIMEDSGKLFHKMTEKDLISWNAMIGGYVQTNHVEGATEFFLHMQQIGVRMDYITYASILGTCKKPEAIKQGKQVHAHIIIAGIERDSFVRNALVTMYAYCGRIDSASKLFVKMPEEDTVSWNAMMAAYVHNGLGEESLKLFHQMQQNGMTVDNFTIASALAACSSLAALGLGKQVHTSIIKVQLDSDIFVETALVDLYAKCGSIEDACLVFDNMSKWRDFSWNTMIAGYAQHGYGEEALELFLQMQQAGMKPKESTFVSVLSACSHAGLVDEGRHWFDSMNQNYGITPRLEHYACMVDVLGRAGCLEEAEDFINKMPLQPSGVVWRSLLGACRVYGNLDKGKRAAECLLDLEPHDAATYVLLSNLYAMAGGWDNVAKVRTKMKKLQVKKDPGCSWIEIKNKVYAFFVDDKAHP